MLKERASLIDVWREDAATGTPPYKYSQFATLYAAWRRECGLVKLSRRKRSTISVKPEDIPALKQWRRSNDRQKWEIAVALLELTGGTSVSQICRKIERSHKTVDNWCRLYESSGISRIIVPRRKQQSKETLMAIDEKKKRLVKLIPSPV